MIEKLADEERVNAACGLLIGYILRLRGAHAANWRAYYLPQMGQTSRSLREVVQQGTASDCLSPYICIGMGDCRMVSVSWLSKHHGWNLPPEDTQFLETMRRVVIRRPRRFIRRSRSLDMDGVDVADRRSSYHAASIGYRRDGSVRYVTRSFLTKVHSRTNYVRMGIRASPSFTSDTFRRCRQTIAN